MAVNRLVSGRKPVDSLDHHLASGGGEALMAAEALGPDGVLDELEISGLRGRGGAGFPTATKWRSIVAGGASAGTRFVVANGAEGEPGTFKDRYLMRRNPYLLVEGLLIAARTVGAERAFIALKASFETERARLIRAVAEVEDAGWAPDVRIDLVAGPDEYLFGEEKALLEVIEGEDPLPRMFPPYVYGLFTNSPQMGWSAGDTLDARAGGSNPTLVNNVETLCTVPVIVRDGGEAYRTFGTGESPGTFIATVSGDTVRHGVDEFEMGTPVAEVLAVLGGGVAGGRSLRYVLSGVANPVLGAGDLDVPASHEGLEAIGSGLGTGGFIVYDDRTDPIELAAAVSRFLSVESCGQCPACKLGCGAVTEMLESAPERRLDVGALSARLRQVSDGARCYLPTQEQRVLASLLPDIRAGVTGETRGLLVTKLVDLGEDRFDIDERQRHKQPDWTYSDDV
ncbi:MAG: NADH-ubiquinone oxidoreductase-F iron-sulfur binding region domain-containing protein [Acidimicrobiales bacterium]